MSILPKASIAVFIIFSPNYTES
jgi:hypothetical protein